MGRNSVANENAAAIGLEGKLVFLDQNVFPTAGGGVVELAAIGGVGFTVLVKGSGMVDAPGAIEASDFPFKNGSNDRQ